MFEGLANWIQGNGFVSNAELDRKKRQDQQQAALNQARASVPFAQYDPNSGKFTNTAQVTQANQDVKTLEMPNIVNQFSPEQLLAAQQHPQGPWSVQLQTAAKQQQLTQPFQERPKTALENYATVSGNIPVWSLANRLGSWAAEGFGNLTGNKDLANTASNFRSNLDIGMSNDQINALPEEQRNKLRLLQTGVELASPLDLVGLTGFLKAPIITGVKQGFKDIVTGGIKEGLSAETKALLKQGVKQQGISGLVGATVAGVADPAIQAYINDGKVDWGQVPGSIATGALWGAGIPSQIASMRNSSRRALGDTVNEVAGSADQAGALTLAKQRILQTADQIEKSAADAPTSQLGKIDDGISTEATAQAKRATAKDAADQLRQQAEQMAVDTPQPQARPITTQDLSNPSVPLTLKRATPEELNARAKAGDTAAIDEINNRFADAQQSVNADTTAPTQEAPVAQVVDNTQPVNNPIDSPITAESRNIADNTIPVDPAAAQTAGNGPLGSIEAEGRQLLADANATLATEGKSVGDLVQKLARANETGIPAQLSPAEQTAFKQLNDAINSAQMTAMRSGLITPDTGNISQYLPTGSADNVLPTQLSDIANQDFNYSMTRSNALSDKQLKAGGENAFLDYYMRGQGSQHLDDATIDAQNATRAETIAREEMFNIPREGNKPDQLDITPEVKTQMESAAIDAADARRAQINAERAQSVGDTKTFKEQAQIANEKALDSAAKNINALQDSVRQRAELIRNSNLSAAQKKAQYSALFDHLDSVIAKKTYIQPMVTSNVLGQVPGRVADQVSKAIASTTDSLTSLISEAGARSSFKRGTGRSLQTDGRTLRKAIKNTDAYKTFNRDLFETQLNKRAGLGNAWTRGVTRLTQAGSRRKAPIKDTVSFFAARAQSEGLKSSDDIARYIMEASRTPEWDKVYGLFYSSRNRFSGVPSFLPDANGNLQMVQTPLDPLFNSIERGLQKAVDMIPGVASRPSLRRNLKTAIRQATLGFPRVIANQGYQAINTASLGAIDLIKAAATRGTDEVSQLKKAVLIKQGLEGLQTGAGAYALGGAIGAAGLVSGAYPTDPAEQQRWQDEGRQEYSINVGGVWVDPFRYAGLAALPLMIGGLIGSGKGSDLGGLTVDIGGALGQNFGVGALQDLTKFLSGDTPQGQSTSLAMNFASQFVPLLSELNSLANSTDPNQRNLKSQDWGQEFINRGINKIPFLRQNLPGKTDSFGNQMKNPGYGVAGILPVQGGDTGVSNDPAQAEVSRLQQLGFEAYPAGVDGQANNYTLKDGQDTAIKLTDAQQNDLNNAIKQGKQKMVTTLISSDAYQSASDENKAKMLKNVYSTNSAGIASEWAKANGIDNAKQSTKGISDKLDANQASALAVADAMDTDTRDKWLEDKTNAVNYHMGKYENAIANGTLTAKDDNLENSSSLHYKAIASQVNATLPYWTATLEEQYQNTSKKELMAMSPDNPVRQALLALDAARASAGVSLKDGDHSATKYGAGEGGTGDNFSFASTKAANAEKSGFQNPTLKSDWNAPLVKPNAIGEASQKVKRKITVKQGVVL